MPGGGSDGMTDTAAGMKVIRNADWLVAWDTAKQRHAYLRNADLAALLAAWGPCGG